MLKTVTRLQFISMLKTRKLENLAVIRQIERALKQQRGYIFKMPSPGSSVILLLSGGIDSIASWGILMEEFGLSVYPLFVDTGEKRAKKERASINYFTHYYQQKYPTLFHRPKVVDLKLNQISVSIEDTLKHIHPDTILDRLTQTNQRLQCNLIIGQPPLYPLYAAIYAHHLYITKNIHLRHIFCSVVRGDGELLPHQTFTALRSVMYYLCTSTGDYSWQFASAVFEKETGLSFYKHDLIAWAHQHQLPLEKTWSCYHSKKYQCGGADCIACASRVNSFRQAGVTDKTTYMALVDQTIQSRIKFKFQSAIQKVKMFVLYRFVS